MMSMHGQGIAIDYARDVVKPRRAGLILLGISLAAAAVCLLTMRQIQQASAEVEDDIARMQKLRWVAGGQSGGDRRDAVGAEETSAVRAAMIDLATPWETLFTGLESITTDAVRLVAVEPDARRQVVRITAEADEAEEMLAYIRQLGQQPVLRDVYLRAQERVSESERQPLRFMVEAVWVPSP